MNITNIYVARDKQVDTSASKLNYAETFRNNQHFDLFKQAICCNTIGTKEESTATE